MEPYQAYSILEPFKVHPVAALVCLIALFLLGAITGSCLEEAYWKRQFAHMASVIRDACEMSSMLLDEEEENG